LGAVLAVIYSIKYTSKVSGLIIAGFSMMDVPEIEEAGKACVPDVYDKWKTKSTDKATMKDYLKKLQSKNHNIRNKYTKMWNFEDELFKIMDFENYSKKKTKFKMNPKDSNVLALFECYYYQNCGFMPKNFIAKNAHKLNKIPGFIIHGRFDLICSPENSYRISKKWTRAKLIIVPMAGHSYGNINNTKELIKAGNSFKKLFSKCNSFYKKKYKCKINYHKGCYSRKS